ELDDIAPLDKNKKHDISVVVDRIKVREGLQQRLAESFETALNLADGIAVVHFMDGEAEDITFSARFACPVCGYAIAELEPRMFSFNNPAGACPTCDGLGVQQVFDPDKLISHPELSLAEGVIKGWDRRSVYYFSQLQAVAEHYRFTLETPWQDLARHEKDIVLYGSGDDEIAFSYVNDRGRRVTREHPFEGVLPNMQRRYRETESSMVREELARYIADRPCPSCHGSRLRKESRHVFVDEHTLPQIVQLPIGEAWDYFQRLTLPGRKGEIAQKVINEIHARLEFLVNVGLDYLNLERSAETLSGGEAQRIRLASQSGAGLVGVMYILDEPSIGLHQRDNDRLLKTLIHLRDLGNTVIVVEHDEDAIRAADHVLDIGPGAGVHGGRIVAQGTP
ncbi:MAG: excinuclease ABC subunit UvrA, partial [Billgrantia desiderata]